LHEGTHTANDHLLSVVPVTDALQVGAAGTGNIASPDTIATISENAMFSADTDDDFMSEQAGSEATSRAEPEVDSSSDSRSRADPEADQSGSRPCARFEEDMHPDPEPADSRASSRPRADFEDDSRTTSPSSPARGRPAPSVEQQTPPQSPSGSSVVGDSGGQATENDETPSPPPPPSPPRVRTRLQKGI
jgi:hypothetical protein